MSEGLGTANTGPPASPEPGHQIREEGEHLQGRPPGDRRGGDLPHNSFNSQKMVAQLPDENLGGLFNLASRAPDDIHKAALLVMGKIGRPWVRSLAEYVLVLWTRDKVACMRADSNGLLPISRQADFRTEVSPSGPPLDMQELRPKKWHREQPPDGGMLHGGWP
mmetsp:Transcript_3106/g.10471  ORF Transcript_3106/g.10471 Transcript_3106/m.10471 type:complete len:164 (+) Transcript_3106:168-659(+)